MVRVTKFFLQSTSFLLSYFILAEEDEEEEESEDEGDKCKAAL
jgi:hypothetical protein